VHFNYSLRRAASLVKIFLGIWTILSWPGILRESRARIGLEVYGEFGFVRSLAVKAVFRNQAIADGLYRECEKHARFLGMWDLYLLTIMAETFFAKRGWTRIDRGNAPEVNCRTEEFKSLCPASAICMKKNFTLAKGLMAGLICKGGLRATGETTASIYLFL
jgi:hypothetical protein